MMSWGFGTGAGMWVSWIVLLLVVILVVLLILRASEPRTPAGRPAGPPTAFQILAERYARGEISTEEYEERLSHLPPESRSPAPGPARCRRRHPSALTLPLRFIEPSPICGTDLHRTALH